MENNTLNKIAQILLKYKTDKNYGTIKNIYNDLYNWVVIDNPEPYIGHTYGKSYDEIFENFDRNSEINLLEIGTQKGGSLLAWKDYFVNGNIFGVDIVDCVLDEYRRDNINYIVNDIKNLEVKNILKDKMFDIIIDDGSHYLEDVLFVIDNYLDLLKVNGFLIVEDAQQPESWVQSIKNKISSNYVLTTVDLRNDTPHTQYDNFLIVIKKIN